MLKNTVWPCLMLIACVSVAESPRFVVAPAREVPIIDRVDIVVVGNHEGALAAAWRAAKLNAKVMLLTDYTFLGGSTVAQARFDSNAKATSTFGRALFDSLTPTNYASLFPVTAAHLLQEAGVTFLYNTRHSGVLVDNQGQLCGVVTANKAGLQAVIAKIVIDATPASAIALAAGASQLPWRVTKLDVSRPRHSVNGKNPELIKQKVPMPSLNWAALNCAENMLREPWHRFVKRPFAHEMSFIVPNPLICEATSTATTLPHPQTLDLGVCKPLGNDRLLVIGSSCAVSRQAATELMRPTVLADVGERLGEQAAKQARTLVLPPNAAISVKTKPPQQGELPELVVSELKEHVRPYYKNKHGVLQQGRDAIPVWGDYDIIVVGGGPAGQAAAIAAGRAGMKTILIEQNGFIGGSIALGIKGFWRGYRQGFNQEWRGKGSPLYLQLLKEAHVDIWYHSQAMGAIMRGQSLAGVEIATWLGRGIVLGKVVIDASGEGDVCAAAGAECFYLNDGDLCLEEASFIGQKLYSDSLPADPIDIAGFTIHHVLAGAYAGHQTYPMAQIRETRRIRGDWVINELDVNSGRTYHDVIAIASSAFDPHGFYSSDYSFAGLMPSTKHVKENVDVYIPLRAILPKGLQNILVVGRNYSTTHDVQAIVRMNADVLNLGYAAGYAAVLSVKNKIPPRDVNIKALQQHLVDIQNLPANDIEKIARDSQPPTEAELIAAAADPSQRANLLTLACGGQKALNPLLTAFHATPSVAQAKALCLLGNTNGVPLLVNWISKMPIPPGKPYARDGFLDVPELEGAMWVVAIPRDKRATAALVAKLRECDSTSGFNTYRSILMALGKIGDPVAVPALMEFLKQPDIQGHQDVEHQTASLAATNFSQAMIELFAASALYRCGDCDDLGKKILTGYLDDWRGIFVRYAGHILSKDPDLVP